MDKTSFPLHGFILFLYRIKLGHRNSDKRPNEFLRPAGTLANRIFHIATVIGTFDLMFATTTVAGIYYQQFQTALISTVAYLILTMVASWLLGRFARRFDVRVEAVGSTSDTPVKVEE